MKKSVVTFIVLATCASLPALALPRFGNEGGGGGASIVCRDQTGTATKAFLYDTYSAIYDPLNSFQLTSSTDSVEIQLQNILNRTRKLEDSTWSSEAAILQRGLDLVERDWVAIQPGTRLAAVSDVDPLILPRDKSCSIETTAHYDDATSKLYVDMEIYHLLSNTDKAALKLHEAIYKYRRTFAGDTTSAITRRIVGALLSASLSPELQDQLSNDLLKSHFIEADSTNKLFDFNPAYLNFFMGSRKITCQAPDGRILTLSTEKNLNQPMGLKTVGSGSMAWIDPDSDLAYMITRSEYHDGSKAWNDMLSLGGTYGSDGYGLTLEQMYPLLLADKYYLDGKTFNGYYSYENERGAGDENVLMSCHFTK